MECQATERYHLGLAPLPPLLGPLDVLLDVHTTGWGIPKHFLPDLLALHTQIEPGVCGVAPDPGEHFCVHVGTQRFEVAHFAIGPWDEFSIHQTALGKALPHDVLQGWRKA